MTDTSGNRKVDGYLKKLKTWKEESTKLREVIRDFELTEDMKWMHPCYMLDGKTSF